MTTTMPRDPGPAGPGARRVATGLVPLAAVTAVPRIAIAQSTSAAGSPASMDLVDVLRQLDFTATALIAIAALIFLLVIWRLVAMVRREKPVRRATRRPDGPARPAGDSFARATLQGTTDWGFDENKRSAVGRAGEITRGGALLETSTRPPSAVSGVQGVAPSGVPDHAPVVQQSPYRTGINPYYLRHERVEGRIDVTEVADVVTQAELLVQLGDPKEAMNVLSRHIRETEKPGPHVWLMLLDLYRTTGREAQYKALAEGFQSLFNAAVPPWPAGHADRDRVLEDYPQILRKTMAGWPGAECRDYLEKLLNDDRGGSRQGFSLVAYRELLFLVDVLAARAEIEAEEADRLGIDRKLNA